MQQMSEQDMAALQEKLKNMSPEELAEYQKQNCIFCQIIGGKIPAKKVYEDDKVIAILDINPASKGHMLVMPKEHYAIMPVVPQDVLGHLFVVAKKLSNSALKALKATGTTVFIANGGVAGQRAQHFMIHIIPRFEADGLFKVKEREIDIADVKKKLSARIGYVPEKKEVKRASEKVSKEKKSEIQKTETKKADKYITSKTAKRFHTQNCAFAQNIREENRIYLTEEEAEESGKKPCTCVSGKKIPLKKEKATKKNEINEIKTGSKKTEKSKAKDKDDEIDEKIEEGEGIDLDAIAQLLG
ncbi:HIT family protein [Candidatus Woesearchaeota archaeon]|nr:HIT family protein [Candidatus Woesearchaeota archaeon]